MLSGKSIFLGLLAGALLSGCSGMVSTEPFQIYEPRTDCVSCKKQEKWGFEKKVIYRNNTVINFASYEPKTNSSRQLERIGLCYGTALDTIKSGATHFRILSKEKWGDWYMKPTPATISAPNLLGISTIQTGGAVRSNRDQSGMWWTNHYYEKGSPNCADPKEFCAKRHTFDPKDCPYEGDELRKRTEEMRGSLACVLKRNPRLLLHEVYSSEAGCGSATDESDSAIIRNAYQLLELDYWVPAEDIVKKFGVLFNKAP